MYALTFLLTWLIWTRNSDVSANTFNLMVVYDIVDNDVLAAAQFAAQLINAGRLRNFNFTHTINIVAVNVSDQQSLTERLCSNDWVWPASVDGILDLTNANSLNVRDMAYQLNAPFMSANWDDIADFSTIRPNPINYVKAINSLLLRGHSINPRILILYEEIFTKDLINSFKSLIMQPSIYYRLIPQNTSDLISLFSWAKIMKISEVVVGSSTRVAINVMTAGFKVGLTDEFVHWYFVSKDLVSSVLLCPECSTLASTVVLHVRRDAVDNLTLKNLLTAVNSATNGAVTSDRYIELVYAFQALEGLAHLINRMIASNQWNAVSLNFSCTFSPDVASATRFTNALSWTKTLTYDSILGLVSFDGTLQNQVDWFSIYQNTIVNGHFSISNLVATWDSRTELSSSAQNIVMRYLTNDSLRVLVKNEPPFVIINKDSNGSIISIDGYSVEILKHVTNYLNLSFTLTEQKDGIYGELLSNGSWNGMIGQIISGKADMALGAITINSEREMVVDFSIPYYDYAGIQLVVNLHKNPTSGDQIFFLKAFTWEVWTVLGTTILIVGLLISMMDWLSPFSFQNRLKCDAIRDGETEGKVFSIKESMWFVLGAYTQAGDSFDPRSFSCRIVVVGFWLFTYLMMAMYTANLAAQLTVAKLNVPPSSMDDYLDQTTYVYSVIENSDAYYYFKRREQIENLFYDYWINSDMRMKASAHSVTQLAIYSTPLYEKYKKVFYRMKKWNFTKDVDDSIDQMKSNGYAIFMETPTIKYIRSQDCDLKAVGEAVAWRPYGIVLQNNSPLTKQLNMALLILQRDRILENLKTTWWSQSKIECAVEDTNNGLNLDTLGGTFLFLLGGVGVAICVLLIEKVVVHIWGIDWIKKTDMTAIISTVNLQKTRDKLVHDNTICCGCLSALQINSMRNLLRSTKVTPEKQPKIIFSVPRAPIVSELRLEEFDQTFSGSEESKNKMQ